MLPKQLMGCNEPVEVLLYLSIYRFLCRTICARVVLQLFTETEPDHHAQPIRLQRQRRLNAREQQYLFGPRIADAWKLLQRSPRPGCRLPHCAREIAFEFMKGDLSDRAQLADSSIRKHPAQP